MNIFKRGRIPTITGIILLILGISTAVTLLQSKQIFRIGASEEVAPKNIRISNINDSSFTISWTTSKETNGYLKWNIGSSLLTQLSYDKPQGNNKSQGHYITLEGLAPETNYRYVINSNGFDYDNNGVPWQIKTGPNLPLPEKPIIIYGSILSPEGRAASKAFVYATAGGGSPLSTITQDDGTWAIQLSQIRTKGLNAYVPINVTNTLVEIAVQSGPDSVTLASIYPAAAKPVPPLTLGQTYNFNNLSPSDVGETPIAELNSSPSATLPTITDSKSPLTPGRPAVSIENPKDGDVLNEIKPEFFGFGPPNKTITITVESDPVSSVVPVDTNGSWQWATPDELEPGKHSVTVTWIDEKGKPQKLSKNFIVQAQTESATSSSNIPTETIPLEETISPSRSKVNAILFFLTPLNIVIAAASLLFIIILILVIERISKNKATKESVFPSTAVSKNPKVKNGSRNPLVKILLTAAALILIGVAGFSGYNIFKGRISLVKTPTPTPSPVLNIPTTFVEPSPTITSEVTSVPTLIPSPTKKVTPTVTIMPVVATSTPRPTLIPTLIPTQIPTSIPTQILTPTPTTIALRISPTEAAALPSAGFDTPSLIAILSGIGLLILSFSLLII